MTADREKHLMALVEQRFKDISGDDARAALVDGFPFGISGLSANVEELAFVLCAWQRSRYGEATPIWELDTAI